MKEIKKTRLARVACEWLAYGYKVKVMGDNGSIITARCEDDIYSFVGRADYVGFEL